MTRVVTMWAVFAIAACERATPEPTPLPTPAPAPVPRVVDAHVRGARVGYAAITEEGSPRHNDNFFSINEDAGTFVVADGVRKTDVDRDPARTAGATIETAPPQCASRAGVERTDCTLALANTRLNHSGSLASLVVATVVGNAIDIQAAGTGDAYVVRAGQLRRLLATTVDAAGTTDHATFARSDTDVRTGDLYVLGSIGLWLTLTPAEIAESLARPATDLEARLAALDARAKARGLRDDMTIILLEIRDAQ